MIDKVVARNWAEYNIFRANAHMTATINGQINAMREKAGLPSLPSSPSSPVNPIVVANNLAEAGIYRLQKALDDSSNLVHRLEKDMAKIVNTVA